MSEHPSSFLISAPSSNSGKTSIMLGLLRALKERGLRVQPFKCGPDYIDTIHHTTAAGKQSVNLDTFMASSEHVKNVYWHYSGKVDVSVAEGVMGLFDGADRMVGSSAEIATLLDIPVILVINARSMAYSAAPLIYGFKNFNKNVRVVGVIFNFVNTVSHYRFLQDACEDAGVEALGYLPENRNLSIPSRHLGLHISAETDYEAIIQKLAEQIPLTVNLDRLLEITSLPIVQTENKKEAIAAQTSAKLRITIARDEAFSFTYHQNIEVLSHFGEITWFSPMRDSHLPETDLLYLPGGYPELFAQTLADNESMRESIHQYCQKGGLTYAECGGLMYLGKTLVTNKGESFPMTGVLNCNTSMESAKMILGYRIMHWNGQDIRGHEFHYSKISDEKLQTEPATLTNAKGIAVDTKLYRSKNTFASYTHLYWGDKPEFIEQLIKTAINAESQSPSGDSRQPKAEV
ncbi:cobyrinate a,c-diamide synthase [Dyadobacter pollutisoli]|uniref:Cobyrinate a,c-diamide synthase n=1 Tax=Dyadobacter pollutisoli TaxID=2910158 RepID=A0A9E8NIF7_9BACT|nr:cobyrinate a,c-diamide synthase [Dyadobacter pollutisoli]WAC15266.1 cobyrinate a,c-diamide synthase [Dyadobacter pollutisoli]